MTCPRELILRDGMLIQQPARELHAMRRNESMFQENAFVCGGLSSELALSDLVGATARIDVADDLYLMVTPAGFSTHRRNLKTQQWESLEWQGNVQHLQILRDASSVEVFINQGEAVSTSRFFGAGVGEKGQFGFRVDSEQAIAARCWDLMVK